MYYTNKVWDTSLERARYQMGHNIKHENSAESTKGVMEGAENGLGTHNECAQLVVVLGGVTPFASEYEGQVF